MHIWLLLIVAIAIFWVVLKAYEHAKAFEEYEKASEEKPSAEPRPKYTPPPVECCQKCCVELSQDNKKHTCDICGSSGCNYCIDFVSWPEHPERHFCDRCMVQAEKMVHFSEMYLGEPPVGECLARFLRGGFYDDTRKALQALKLDTLKMKYNMLIDVAEEKRPASRGTYKYTQWQWKGRP